MQQLYGLWRFRPMKIKILCFLLVFGSFGVSSLLGQQLRSMTVAEFEKQIPKTSDTLYVFNFWATWCGPCVEELPYFVQLDSMTTDKPVKVILVSLDFAGTEEAQLVPFLKKRSIQTEVWFLKDAHGRSAKGWIDRVAPEWSGAIPATLLVGGGEEVYEFKETTFTLESLTAWVTPFYPKTK